MKSRLVICCILPALLLAACARDDGPDFEEGWTRAIHRQAARDTGSVFDDYTGRAWLSESEPGKDGLSLPDSEGADTKGRGDALVAAEKELCRQFVLDDSVGDDEYFYQRMIITTVLFETVWGSAWSRASDAVLEAQREVDAWLEENGPSTEGLTFGTPKYDEALAERNRLSEERWATFPPQVSEAREELNELSKRYHAAAYSADGVRTVQELIIDACGIELPRGYEYPTATQLGIQVAKE